MQEEDGRIVPIETTEQALEAEQKKLAVFQIGEELEVKGGRFRVRSFGKRSLVLESLPRTAIVGEA